MLAKRFAALVVTSVAFILNGCVAVVPYTPTTDLVGQSSRESVQDELSELVKHATSPVITGVTFSEDTITFDLNAQHNVGLWFGAGVGQGRHGLHLPSLQRADVYENHYVFLVGAGDAVVMKVLFTNPDHARKFVDLVLSLKGA